jgi:hypothetical protein
MTGIVILGGLHHKNKNGIELMSKVRNIPIVITNDEQFAARHPYPYVIVTDRPKIVADFSNKKVLIGPHLDHNNNKLVDKNQTCNCLSAWVEVLLKAYGATCNFVYLPFGVDVDKFKSGAEERSKVFLYAKLRDPTLIAKIEKSYKFDAVFRYGSYQESDYCNFLKTAKFGVWIGRHESQGFAVQEALSCNVPLLVLDVDDVYDEYSVHWQRIDNMPSATVIPYWDDSCGEVCKKPYDDFTSKLALLESKIKNNEYSPREYILKTLKPSVCMDRFCQYFGIGLDVVCVTSVVNVSSNPLCYTNVRSIYTPEQRLEQTLNSIQSIKSRLPHACIVLVEGSKLNKSQKIALTEQVDYLFDASHMSSIHCPYKSLAEVEMLEYAISCISSKIKIQTFYKLSGRYTLNDRFQPNDWANQTKAKYQDGSMSTIFYSVKSDDMANFLSIINESKTSLAKGQSVEEYFCNSGLWQNKAEYIGVNGNIAVDGYVINI